MAEKYFPQPSGTNAQQHFSVVPSAEIERSTFDRSHGLKTCFNAGSLIPVYVDEVLPGDTFEMKSTGFCRLATPLKPIMDNMYLDTFFFFVPYRLVWDNWQKFMGERVNPTDDPSIYTIPQTVIDIGNTLVPAETSLWRHMGIPFLEGGTGSVSVSALPFRAYRLIYNEWFRDQNLIPTIAMNTDDGPDDWVDQTVAGRAKRHDYFTSCLPWPQKGDPVFIPIASSADVVSNNLPIQIRGVTDNTDRNLTAFFNTENRMGYSGTQISTQNTKFGTETGLMVDLTNATAVSINDLRTAFQIQRLLERDARGGTRYIEIILSHFGVRSDDARLQRPEYLGGGTSMVNINPIASTAPLVDAPQANLAAFGTGTVKGGFSKSFTEHGVIIGIVSARADLTYQNGIERFWSRQTRYDFYWPALAHLGEQAVLKKELYADGSAADNNVFGYQERYAEYRYKPSRITGQFQSQDPQSLDVWHLAQDLTALSSNLDFFFLAEQPPIDRIIAVPSEPHFLCDMWFQLKCTRPMPVYSVPGLIDHF